MPDLFASEQDYITRPDKPHLRVRLIPQPRPNMSIVQLQIRRDFLTDKQIEVYEQAQTVTEVLLFIGAVFDPDWIDVMLARFECDSAFDALAKAATLLEYEGYDPKGFETDDA